MPGHQRAYIEYYFWLLAVPLSLPDVYALTGGILLAQRSWQRQAYRVGALKRWRERLATILEEHGLDPAPSLDPAASARAMA